MNFWVMMIIIGAYGFFLLGGVGWEMVNAGEDVDMTSLFTGLYFFGSITLLGIAGLLK